MTLDEARDFIKASFSNGRLASSWLVNASPDGAGDELAAWMAQLVACEGANTPCGVCAKCRQVASRSWCDCLWVNPMKKSRVISVEQMRRGSGDNKIPPPYLLQWLSETSFEGGWKVAIVNYADCMNTAAANAFLKMLEEPPSKTLIILVTDSPQKLLPTIRSRCQQVDIAEPPRELRDEWRGRILSALSGTRHGGPLAATALAGHIVAVLDEMKGDAERAVKAEADPDFSDEEIDALVSARFRGDRMVLVQTMQRWFRDILVSKAGGTDIHYAEYADEIKARASRLTLGEAMRNVDMLEDLARQLDRNMSEAAILPYWADRLFTGAENP